MLAVTSKTQPVNSNNRNATVIDFGMADHDLYVQMVEASPGGLLLVDVCREDYPPVYVNVVFERLPGYPRNEVLVGTVDSCTPVRNHPMRSRRSVLVWKHLVQQPVHVQEKELRTACRERAKLATRWLATAKQPGGDQVRCRLPV